MKTQRSGKTEEHIHQAEQRGNCGKTANKRAKEDQSYFNRVCLYRVLSPPLPVSGDKNVLFFLVQGKKLFHWNSYALLLGTKGEGTGPCTCYFSIAFSSK